MARRASLFLRARRAPSRKRLNVWPATPHCANAWGARHMPPRSTNIPGKLSRSRYATSMRGCVAASKSIDACGSHMRIAFVLHDYNRSGGHSRYVAELSVRFARDHEVNVFATHLSKDKRDA